MIKKSRKMMVCFIILTMVIMTWPTAAFTQTDSLDAAMGIERLNESTIKLTAESTGGINVQYRFDMRVMGTGGDYTMLRDFDEDPVFTWDDAEDGGLKRVNFSIFF